MADMNCRGGVDTTGCVLIVPDTKQAEMFEESFSASDINK